MKFIFSDGRELKRDYSFAAGMCPLFPGNW